MHPMDLFQQQVSNRRRTWLVMAIFVAFLFFLGFGFDTFYLRTRVPITGLVALAAGAVGAYLSYRSGDRAVLASAGAVPISDLQGPSVSEADRLEYRQLENVIEEMTIASGLPRPALFVIPDPDPNAFATGRDPEHASIAVTKGLLDALNREELQAVVAHELSHVRNFDIRLMTVVAALVGAIVLLADFLRRGLSWGGGRKGRGSRDKGGGAAGAVVFVVWIVAVLLAPVIGQVLAMMVSRRREYLADASAAEMTRNPQALASALHTIEFASEPTNSIKRGTANLCIADPLGRAAGKREGRLADLFASHPPMVKRISALREMAYQSARE
ncbi:MAG: M48 family metallopeptidase [Acidobacteria bacterium]|nr:M48 family metallopeptidase [Acidobacteriota bacterium]